MADAHLTADWLASPAGAEVIAAAQGAAAGPEDVARLRRRFPDTPTELVGAAIHQAWLRARERKRWGRSTGFLLTTDGLEQATRPAVSQFHAQRATELAGSSAVIVDLTCGLGFDAAALARAGHHVTAVERDPDIAAFARCNLAALGVDVATADAQDVALPEGTDLVFIDPARRDPSAARDARGGSARQLDPAAWSPDWPWISELGTRVTVLAKAAPGIDDRHLEGWDADFVSADGDLVEALCASQGHGRRRAVLLRAGRSAVVDGGHVTRARELGGFLIVPDPALVRARALDYIADRIGGGLVHPRISWLTADDADAAQRLAADPMRPAAVFAVEHVTALDAKALKPLIRNTPHSALTIMTRGVQVDVERLRRQLATAQVPTAPELVLALYRGQDRSVAVLARRITPDSA